MSLQLLRRTLFNFNSVEDLTTPPPFTTALDRNPSFLLTYWCCSCAVVIILFRAIGRYIRTEHLYRDDKLMLLSIVPLAIRLAFAHVVLKYGTNNVQDPAALESAEVRRRQIGSGMVLGARVFYAVFIWMQKFCITEFYRRLIEHIWIRSYEIGLIIIRWSLLGTFLAAIVTVFAECRPTDMLWQVYPDPGPACRQSLVPLISMGALNIATDLLLIIFPIPVIWRSHFPLSKKIQLTITTFSLSSLCIAITLVRIPSIIQEHADQTFRTLWASADILVATAVANAVVIKGFTRDRGVKKNRFKISPEEVVEHRGLKGKRMERSDTGLTTFGLASPVSESTPNVIKPEMAVVSDDRIVGKEIMAGPCRGGVPWDEMRLDDPGGLLRPDRVIGKWEI